MSPTRIQHRACILAALLVAVLSVAVPAAMLDISAAGSVMQSSDGFGSSGAEKAIDGDTQTLSLTRDIPDSYWMVRFHERQVLTRVEIVSGDGRFDPRIGNLVVRVFDMDGQTVFQATIVDPGGGGTWAADLPAGTRGRSVRIGLENGLTNSGGTHEVGLAEVRLYGYAAGSGGPVDLQTYATVYQSSVYGGLSADRAIDGDPATYTHTDNDPNSYWFVTLEEPMEIRHVEIVNRDGVDARLAGLVLRILDNSSNTVAVTTLTNPGAGATWHYTPPAGTTGRYVRVGLENGGRNGNGDYYVTLAEFNIFTTTNLADGKHSYMIRYLDSVSPASNANDGNHATESKTTSRSVDGYWEVDLGASFALDAVRTVAADGFAQRMSHATVRLFDENHDSVFSQHLAGLNPTFDVGVPGLRHARFVRVGFENKERSHATGGIEWYLGIKEVQVFGRPSAEVGILDFSASTDRINAGQSVTLSWRVEELDALELHPAGGSVGAFTDSQGNGTHVLSPAVSTEYILVGTAAHGTYTRAVTVLVDDQPLPPRISEIVADNRLSLRDGRNDAPDWIELRNPNNEPLNMSGYGLSDRADRPMKWVFPATNVPPHGYVIVFASGRNNPVDDEGWLHADFRLDADTESVVLTAPDGVTLLDAVTNYPPQMEDLAYGRPIEGGVTFIEPTPLAPNLAATYAGWLHPLEFSHERGFHTNAFTLVITNVNTNAAVTYSLDGTEPSEAYTAALPVTGTACVRAAVRRDGYKSPRTQTHTYIFIDDVLTSSVMNQSTLQSYADRARQGLLDLPTFSVVVPDVPNHGNTNDYVEREASVELIWPDGSEKDMQSNCGFFRFGGAWTLMAKKNYRLKFRPEYGNRKFSAPLFNGFDRGFKVEESFDQIDLRGGGHDMRQRGFYMSARFTEDTMLDMGSLNPHGRFAHLYINGTYWGQFHCRERLVDRFLADYLGGPAEDYVSVRGNDNVGSTFILGMPAPPKHEPWQSVLDNRGDYVKQAPYVDMSHLIDFNLMWTYGNCETEYRAAGPLAAGSGFKFWIADADGFLRDNNKQPSNPGPAGIFGQLVSEEHVDFMALLADRIYKHFFNDGALTPARNEARLNERMDEIYNSLVDECARWGQRTPSNWESYAESIRTTMFQTRTAELFSYLRNRGMYPSFDPPMLNQHGGSVSNGFEVTLSSGDGTIYYTLDGSDPRLPGGAVAPTARIYGGGGTATNTLLPAGSIWRYWDAGSLPASNWYEIAFDDGLWPYGPAELGSDTEGGEATIIDYDRGETCYFRTEFTVSGLAGVDQLVAELQRDDGAVIYLNGAELFRDNMPDGDIEYGTRATNTVGGSDESAFFLHTLPATGLAAGVNVLAAELHQVNSTSSDVSFDLALKARSVSSGSIIITNNVVLRTRVWTGSEWSALSEAHFLLAERRAVDTGMVAVTEIHYNPSDGDTYEFIEVQNVSTSLVDLTGATLSDGVDFWFPYGFSLAPGELAVVVEDELAFSNRYQTATSAWYHAGINIAGQWSGALADEGERVALSASNGVEVLALTYDAGGDWPERANGRGSSLELIDPGAVPDAEPGLGGYLANGLNWQSSSLYHGSPGRIDDFARPVVINEVLAHTDAETDWVELHNRGVDPVPLSGLFLSDNHDWPTRYEIPTGTVVNAGEFLSVGAGVLGFGFSELGSDILLTEATGTNIYRFYDTVDFPAVEREEPFGRYRKSDGYYDFTELRAKTRDDTNALPRIGPVVLSEIMYHPATGMAEYVEMVCITNTPVPLYHPAHPTNTWELSGAVSFSFPTGLVMNPCDVWIVCATSPAAFRSAYGVSPSVPVYGPWTGALNNAGESVKLRYPGDPELDGTVPYYRMDRVNYRPRAPWPTAADTGGASLERLPLEGYGNDPVTWYASAPGGTPGVADGNRLPVIDATGTNTVDEGQTVSLTVWGTDADVPWQTLLISAVGAPMGALFNAETGLFEWSTGESHGPGTYPVSFVARDNACVPGAATQVVHVTVREVNQPPLLDPVADIIYPAGTPFNLALHAWDPDLPSQVLGFAESGLPAGLTLDTGSGLLGGSALSTGTHPVVVVVSDDQTPALSVTNAFSLTLTESFEIGGDFDPGQGAQLTFPALTGETYEVEYTDTLMPADWILLQRFSGVTSNRLHLVDPAYPTQTRRLYRIRWIR